MTGAHKRLFAPSDMPSYALSKKRGGNVMSFKRGLLLAAALAIVTAVPAMAQLNPQRAITLVVPIGAGGGVDATGRLIAEKLQERLKQPVVVENRPAGGGMVGADSVAKAAPDGHTLLVIESSAVLHKWLRKDVPFDVIADFAPVAQVATSPLILFSLSSFPANDAKELIALARKEPGKLSVGIPGVGTPHHLAFMMMNALGKIDILAVPYRGAALVTNDVLGGQIPLGWAAPTAVLPHVAAGKAKVLGVASPQRLPSLPQVPTIAESGVPGFSIEVFFGIAAPAKVPADLVAKLNQELAEISKLPDVQERISKAGLLPTYRDTAEFRALIKNDHERFGKIIRDAGIEPN
jgi:tripartite-type tricarboxylate transporter receptor subunit TctC